MREGKGDFLIRKLALSLLLAAAVPAVAWPQISLGGFCRAFSTDIPSGFTRLQPVNVNDDRFTDLFCFSPDTAAALVMQGEPGTGFSLLSAPAMRYPISEAVIADRGPSGLPRIFFASRSARKAGFLEIDNKGGVSTQRHFALDYPPGDISAIDTDFDGKLEYLVGGMLYQGITLIDQEDDEWTVTTFADSLTYSNLFFADLNQDEFQDIAAYDLYQATIHYFINHANNHFVWRQSVQVHPGVNTVLPARYPIAGNELFYYLTDDGLQAASFKEEERTITSLVSGSAFRKMLAWDYNRDGRNDIAALVKEQQGISLRFQTTENRFSDELRLFGGSCIDDMIPLRTFLNDGIAAIDGHGRLYTLSTLRGVKDSAAIALDISPDVIGSFNYLNDTMRDLYFIDHASMQFAMLLFNSQGIPSTYLSTPVSEPFDRVYVDDESPYNKVFCLYSAEGSSVEVVNYAFSGQAIEKYYLYVDGRIKDVRIMKEDVESVDIKVAWHDGTELQLSTFEFGEKRRHESVKQLFRGKVVTAAIDLSSNFNVWSVEDDSLHLSYLTHDVSIFRDRLASFPAAGRTVDYAAMLTPFEGEEEKYVSFLSGQKFILLADGERASRFEFSKPLRKKTPGAQFSKVRFLAGTEQIVRFAPTASQVTMFDPLEGFFWVGRKDYPLPPDFRNGHVTELVPGGLHLIYRSGNSELITIEDLTDE